jgi:hypothetical protein
MPDDVTIVGGLGMYLAGKANRVGDVDIAITRSLCARYWDFLEILSLHGVVSLFDVLERPAYPWVYCHPQIAHARALTADGEATLRGLTHGNLDVCFSEADLSEIPRSCQWVRCLQKADLQAMDAEKRAMTIAADHQAFRQDIKNGEKQPRQQQRHAELGLLYAWS